jgi:hypothetical protein
MVPNNFDTKMLRILPTKEIKLFHSGSRVGLAYMPRAIFEEEKKDIFSPGYFWVRSSGDPEIPNKMTTQPPF